MADPPAPGSAEPALPDADPIRRGSLVIADKVAERIAAKAARDTVGVQPRTAALDKLTGRELPRVTVMISADRVRAAVHVAVPWPYPLTEVTAAVRDNVAAALSEMAGLHVDGVDVAVSSVVAGDGTGRTRILR